MAVFLPIVEQKIILPILEGTYAGATAVRRAPAMELRKVKVRKYGKGRRYRKTNIFRESYRR